MVQVSPPAPHMRQSFELKQCARQMAFTHSAPPPQSALVWHCGVRPVLATQTPPEHTSFAGQSVFVEQLLWQVPLMQVLPAPQSLFAVHCVPPFGSLTQWPPEQIWPVPQVELSVQAFWHWPFTHRPP